MVVEMGALNPSQDYALGAKEIQYHSPIYVCAVKVENIVTQSSAKGAKKTPSFPLASISLKG